MLSYLLAIAVAAASLSLFFAAFFAPALHRKDDFLWSGVGLIYALVLWICAEQIRGSVLLGQGAATALLLSLGWQTLRLRRALAYPEATVAEFSLASWLQNRFKAKKSVVPPVITKPATTSSSVSPLEPNLVETLEQGAEAVKETTQDLVDDLGDRTDSALAAGAETSETLLQQGKDAVEVAQDWVEEKVAESNSAINNLSNTPIPYSPPPKSGFSFKSLFGRGKVNKTPAVRPEAIADLIEETVEPIIEDDWDETVDNTPEFTDSIVEETIATDLRVPSSETIDEAKVESGVLDKLEQEFQPYVTDNDAETLIESYAERKIKPIAESITPEAITPTETEAQINPEAIAEPDSNESEGDREDQNRDNDGDISNS